jgi:hypothetical protein
MSYQGSYSVGATVYWIFATAVDGVPTVFSGSPAVVCYKNSLTQSTAGITLTVNYDSVTGQNQVIIDTSADTAFYTTNTMFSVVISVGTVGGNTVVGRPVGFFSLEAETINSVKNSTGSVIGPVGSVAGGVALGVPRVIVPGNRT